MCTAADGAHILCAAFELIPILQAGPDVFGKVLNLTAQGWQVHLWYDAVSHADSAIADHGVHVVADACR